MAIAGTSGKRQKPLIWTSGNYNSVKQVFPPSQYDFMDMESENRERREQGLLLPQERDALFRKLNLDTKLAQMDDLDKDLLVASVRYYSVSELAKMYPMLTPGQLNRLKAAVERIK